MREVTSEQFHNKFMATHTLVTQLEAYWSEILPTVPRPSRSQFEKWVHIHKYSAEPLKHAIRSAARRLTRIRFNDTQHPVQYCSAVAIAFLKAEQEAAAKAGVA